MPINYNQYHPKWSLIRRLLLKRAGNCCECCSAQNREPHPLTGSIVYLNVAHLDRDRNNNRFWNLAVLCQRCHLIYDINQRVFSYKYGYETQYMNYRLFHLPVPVVRNIREYIPNLFATRRMLKKKRTVATNLLF